MSQPTPVPLDPSAIPDRARAVMAAAKFPQLATMDGEQPRLRPVSPVKTDDFTVYVANLRFYNKTKEIEANLMKNLKRKKQINYYKCYLKIFLN